MSNNKEHNVLLFSDDFTVTSDDVLNTLVKEKNWESRYRHIMLLGKKLPKLDQELKVASALVQGCESSVWLHHKWQGETLQIAASSDAKIVKGLVAIVLAAFNKKTKDEIQAFDVAEYFDQLKLADHLSPSRTNGLFAIVEKIKTISK